MVGEVKALFKVFVALFSQFFEVRNQQFARSKEFPHCLRRFLNKLAVGRLRNLGQLFLDQSVSIRPRELEKVCHSPCHEYKLWIKRCQFESSKNQRVSQ